ncbi:hypothetical protein ACJMK2_017819 [Sinanodonta woodiana]|uniref:Uncharacterized protein n=1 Tax=Sinanodonta woodiana TaxID=1069815 RepID=A0ABD3UEQ7_SINWO
MFQSAFISCICTILLISLTAAELPATLPERNASIPDPDKLAETLGKQVFTSCGKLHGANVTEINLDYLMNSICSFLEQYVSCVIQGLTNPTTYIDNIVRRIINKDALMASFQKACSSRSVLDANAECMRNQSILMSTTCLNDSKTNLSQLMEGMSSSSSCRNYVFTVNCLADAYSVCSAEASNIFRSTYLNLLTTECRNRTQT